MIVVYTCDIIGSRLLGTRARKKLQSLIGDAFRQACSQFPQCRTDYSSFAVTQGDEFQFYSAQQTDFYKFLLYFRIQLSLSVIESPVFFRAGIGFGSKATMGKTSYEMDGTAFFNSRTALNGFQTNENHNKLTRLVHTKPRISSLANDILMFCDELEYSWSREQRQVVLFALENKKQSFIADKIRSSQQNVSKTLKAARWEYISSVLKNLEKGL